MRFHGSDFQMAVIYLFPSAPCTEFITPNQMVWFLLYFLALNCSSLCWKEAIDMDFMVELFFLGMQLSEHSKCEDAYGEDVMYSWLIIQYASLPFPSYVASEFLT